MVHDSDNFVVHLMDFHMKQEVVAVIMENNIVAFLKEQGLFLINTKNCFISLKIHLFSRMMRGSSHFGWIFLLIIIVLIVVFLFVRHRRQNQSIKMPFAFSFVLYRFSFSRRCCNGSNGTST